MLRKKPYYGPIPEPYESQRAAIQKELTRLVREEPETQTNLDARLELVNERHKISQQGIQAMGGLEEINRHRIEVEAATEPDVYKQKKTNLKTAIKSGTTQ